MTTQATDARATGETATETLRHLLLVLVTVRAHLLAFSVPYMWFWSEGLDGIVRIALVVAHGTALLALGTASTTIDRNRGMLPRLGLLEGGRWTRSDILPTYGQVLALIALAALAALFATTVAWPVPASIMLLLVGGWAWARLPLSVKYLGSPDWGAPVLALVLPATALSLATPAAPPPSSVVAAVAFMVAIMLATHLRDREADLAADVPTVATRRPNDTRGWLRMSAIVSALVVFAGLYTPLSPFEWLGALGALAFAIGPAARSTRVEILTAAHAVVGLYWLFG